MKADSHYKVAVGELIDWCVNTHMIAHSLYLCHHKFITSREQNIFFFFLLFPVFIHRFQQQIPVFLFSSLQPKEVVAS